MQENISIDEWVHIVAIYDYTTNTIQLYKNGILKDTDYFTDYNITPENGTAPLRIGTRDFASYFKGSIDDLRFYNRVLSASETNELYFEDNTTLSLTSPTVSKSDPILIYPNPTNQVLSIDSSIAIKHIEIVNSNGFITHPKDISPTSNKKHTIDISNLASGVYFIKIKTLKETTVTKFVKE